MKKLLKYIEIFFQKKGHLVVLFTVLLFMPQLAFATEGETTAQTVEQTMMVMASTLIRVLNMLLWPILLMIGDLMNSDLIVGPGMEERLLSIWQQIRNLVNIAFVLVLLVMAFYNVSGFAKEGNFALKTGLPKLIIGLILVNFTFLGGKIILDVSNIATNAVFALPEIVEASGTFKFETSVNEFEKNVCMHKDSTGTDVPYVKTDKDIPPVTTIFCIDDSGEYISTINTTYKSKFFTKLNASNAGLIIAVNMGHLADLQFADTNVTSIGDLVVNQLFSMIMFVIFAISYIVLALVLVARVAVLWVALAFSPVVVLFYVVPELKSSAGSAGNASEQVLTHILAPIKIGIVITVGFMMMDAMNGAIGTATSVISSTTKVKDLGGALLITGIADLQRLLIAIVSIYIIWKGIFSAVDGTLASDLANKVKGVAEGAGSSILGSIKYAPLVPVQVGDKGAKQEGFSYNELKSLPGLYLQAFQSDQEKKAYEFAKNSPLGQYLKMGGEVPELKTLAARIASGAATSADIKTALTSGSGINAATTSEEKANYAELIRSIIDKYAGGDTKLVERLEKSKNNGPEMGRILEEIILKNPTGLSGWTEADRNAMKFGAPPPATPASGATGATGTSGTAGGTPPPAAPAPVDMKATLETKTTLPAGVKLDIPAGVKIDPTVTLSNIKTQADADKLKGTAVDVQKKIDDYFKDPANKGVKVIDVSKLK